MAKLPVLSGKEIIKALGRAGFDVSRQKGSHVVMVRFVEGRKQIVVIPYHKEIDPGTLIAIISQAGMTREEFLRLLQK